MPKVISIRVDPETCTCSQACVPECPEVLDGDTENGVPRVRDGAERYFESHVEQLKMAACVCPVDAILLEVSDA
jgi:ferredoxin